MVPTRLVARFHIHRRAVASISAIAGLSAALHIWAMPPDGFFCGDQGTKYLQVRAVAEQGVLTPWIEGPARVLDPDGRFQEPFLLESGPHLVGIFPWILAALAAPFYTLLGLQGLYVIPTLSGLVAFVAGCAIGRRLGDPWNGCVAGWMALVGTPLLFYSHELWEHAPAAAAVLVALALLIPLAGDGDPRLSHARYFGTGACLGLAAAFREESLVAVPAVLVALLATSRRRVSPSGVASLALGLVAVLAATTAVDVAVYGTPFPHRLTSNMASLPASFLDTRREVGASLLMPVRYSAVFLVALGIVPAAQLVSRSRRWLPAHTATVALAGTCVLPPMLALMTGPRGVHPALNTATIAHTWLFVCLLPYAILSLADEPVRRLARFLVLTGTLFVLGVVALAPIPGGAQWSARFLLPAAAPLAIAATPVLYGALVTQPSWGTRLTRAAALSIIVSCLVIDAWGLRLLVFTKRVYANLTHTAGRLVTPGDVMVSAVFWFPQVTATMYPTRPWLYARSAEDVPRIATAAALQGFRRLAVISSEPEVHYAPPPRLALLDGRVLEQRGHEYLAGGFRGLIVYWYDLPEP